MGHSIKTKTESKSVLTIFVFPRMPMECQGRDWKHKGCHQRQREDGTDRHSCETITTESWPELTKNMREKNTKNIYTITVMFLTSRGIYCTFCKRSRGGGWMLDLLNHSSDWVLCTVSLLTMLPWNFIKRFMSNLGCFIINALALCKEFIKLTRKCFNKSIFFLLLAVTFILGDVWVG